MTQRFLMGGTVVALAAVLGACTTKKQEAPDLTGPSEFGTSVAVTVSPDILQQDGASQSIVTVTARDPNDQPVRNLGVRIETRVNGTAMDFGSLSARSLVTGSDGRATLVYTAPTSVGVAVDPFVVVEIIATPLGNDFNNSASRSASLRLVHQGPVAPPDGLRPAFTFTPSAPTDHQRILFDASASQSPANNPIAEYLWNFGDGRTAAGVIQTHEYNAPGTYVVTLTLKDAYGRSASTAQTITVGAGVNPSASFTFSPTDPLPGTTVNFNAQESRAAPGRTIVSYSWDFGDGSPLGSGPLTSHRYPLLGNYTVTLLVTDDAGRTAVASQTVPVQFPDEEAASAPARKKR